MGVLQRFERRLEGLVEGAFARVFGGVVQPVEVAAALQREAADNKVLVAQGRVLVPNSYVVELGDSDGERLEEYSAPLRRELADMVTEHARDQGWSFVGPVDVRFERSQELGTGTFRVRSAVAAAPPQSRSPVPAAPRLVVTAADPRSQEAGERVVPLDRPVTVLGRGADADVVLHDTGVSRRHAEVRIDADGSAVLVDLRSTNGTSLNGRRVQQSELTDGDRIEVGGTALVFRVDGS